MIIQYGQALSNYFYDVFVAKFDFWLAFRLGRANCSSPRASWCNGSRASAPATAWCRWRSGSARWAAA